jgi:hypothetical protein
MAARDEAGRVYAAIAEAYDRRGEAGMRDRFLVLAADAALAAGQPAEAERLRRRLLEYNPHHLLKPYASFAQAATAPDPAAYIKDLRQSYPPDAAASLLESLRASDGADRPDGGTSPEIDRGPDATLPLAPAHEPAIYRIRDDADDAVGGAPPPDLAATLPPGRRRHDLAATLPPGTVSPLARPARGPAADRPGRPAPAPAPRPASGGPVVVLPPATPPGDSGPGDVPEGAWLGALLFGVLMTAGLAVLGFTLARPFLTGIGGGTP